MMKNKIIPFIILLAILLTSQADEGGLNPASLINPASKAVSEQLEATYRGFASDLLWNPTVKCTPSATGCTTTANIDKVAELFFKIMVPFYVVAIIFTGLFFIVKGGSPKGRSRARSMLLKLFLGVLFVLMSPSIYQAMIDLSARGVEWILYGQSIQINLLLFQINFDRLFTADMIDIDKVGDTAMYTGVTTSIIFSCCALAVMVWAKIILYIRYFYVLYYAVFFPFVLGCFTFDLTKGFGKRWLNSAIKWIFVPVVQAFILVFMIGILHSIEGVTPTTAPAPPSPPFDPVPLQEMAAALGALMIFIQGLRWYFSDSPEERLKVRKGIIYVVIGLIVVFGYTGIMAMLYSPPNMTVGNVPWYSNLIGKVLAHYMMWMTVMAGMAVYAFAPMLMGQIMGWMGAGVEAVGLGSGRNWMIAAGGVLRGQGAHAVTQAFGEFTRQRAWERAFNAASGMGSSSGPSWGVAGGYGRDTGIGGALGNAHSVRMGVGSTGTAAQGGGQGQAAGGGQSGGYSGGQSGGYSGGQSGGYAGGQQRGGYSGGGSGGRRVSQTSSGQSGGIGQSRPISPIVQRMKADSTGGNTLTERIISDNKAREEQIAADKAKSWGYSNEGGPDDEDIFSSIKHTTQDVKAPPTRGGGFRPTQFKENQTETRSFNQIPSESEPTDSPTTGQPIPGKTLSQPTSKDDEIQKAGAKAENIRTKRNMGLEAQKQKMEADQINKLHENMLKKYGREWDMLCKKHGKNEVDRVYMMGVQDGKRMEDLTLQDWEDMIQDSRRNN